ncbi:MAG: EAL domain-containing protein, partial [Asticcacaulis sp.]|nr:EAL domain-containing protein [Asticcacaulis sp.]
GVSPKRIDFEITETSIAYDVQQAQAAVIAFRALGVGISLDDFGTGYSSLSHVHRLELDKIKVDRSFVADVTDNPVSHKIVKSLIALCGDMGLDCVLEGVETGAQLERLRELGCTLVQGYYFAKPMPAADVTHYLETEPDLPSRRRMGL